MSELEKLTEYIVSFSRKHSLYVEESASGRFRIFTDHASGITLFLEVKSPTKFSFYFLERTYDIVYHGDRTDIHVIMSLMFASFLREFNTEISCSLFDIPHPVVEDEIWGRYIMPEQTPLLWGITSWEKLSDTISKIIISVAMWRELFWQFVGCPCQDCLKIIGIDRNDREYELPSELSHDENKLLKHTLNLNYGNRKRPEWSYFYDMKNEITIIKSETLSMYLEALQNLSENKREVVDGMKGKFVLHGELKNYLANSDIAELKKLFKILGHKSNSKSIRILPLENMMMAVAKPYIIALGRFCGIHKFKIERESLRTRHNRESELIFPIALFEWVEDTCPEQFEGLIKALLEREPNVVSVRKASPMNQGDGGRDLLIEWKIRENGVVSQAHPPTLQMRVVGQCKSSNKSVGKNKVLDIRDTVESHNAQGYFLAVSTQISTHLTRKLEELQAKGIWTEWWNRDDIEIRLSKNQDLLPLFPLVVKAKHQIKFVEQD
ncbi:hypothetical protein AD998_20230 [bacterium 336/3]|nr:hypothetical protein AD998_20230 [bacterium 336/3]